MFPLRFPSGLYKRAFLGPSQSNIMRGNDEAML